MNLKEYQEFASRTINGDLSREQRFNNAVYGLVGESGEVVELLKKHLFHAHELDKQALTKELGDVLWYVAALCTAADLSLNDVARYNIAKLRRRYPTGFSAEKSLDRSESE